jgi:hypothetical protein
LEQRIARVRVELAAVCGPEVRQTWEGHTANWRRRHPSWLLENMHEALWGARGDPAAVSTRLAAIFGTEAGELVIATAAWMPPCPQSLVEVLARGGVAPWGSPWRLTPLQLWQHLERALATRPRPPPGDLAAASNRLDGYRAIGALGSPMTMSELVQALDDRERRQRPAALARLLVGLPLPMADMPRL